MPPAQTSACARPSATALAACTIEACGSARTAAHRVGGLGDRDRRVDHLDARRRLAELVRGAEQDARARPVRPPAPRLPRPRPGPGRRRCSPPRRPRRRGRLLQTADPAGGASGSHRLVVVVIVIVRARASRPRDRRRCRTPGTPGAAGGGCGTADRRSRRERRSCAGPAAWRCGCGTAFSWGPPSTQKATSPATRYSSSSSLSFAQRGSGGARGDAPAPASLRSAAHTGQSPAQSSRRAPSAGTRARTRRAPSRARSSVSSCDVGALELLAPSPCAVVDLTRLHRRRSGDASLQAAHAGADGPRLEAQPQRVPAADHPRDVELDGHAHRLGAGSARRPARQRSISPRAASRRALARAQPQAGQVEVVGSGCHRPQASVACDRDPGARYRGGEVLVTRVRDGVPLAELALEDLAGRVARQLLHEHHLARHLVAGEVLLDVGLDGPLRSDLAGVSPHDEGPQPLAELLVGNADDGDLLDRRCGRRAGPRPRAGTRSPRR